MDEAAAKATATYLKLSSSVGDRPARHATRAVLLHLDLLRHVPPKKRDLATRDIAQALVDQSTQESSLCAALLLEKAAHAFLSARMQRKYAFYLILAGWAPDEPQNLLGFLHLIVLAHGRESKEYSLLVCA